MLKGEAGAVGYHADIYLLKPSKIVWQGNHAASRLLARPSALLFPHPYLLGLRLATNTYGLFANHNTPHR